MDLHIIDGSGFIHRAFHALPPLIRKTDGVPCGAALGFCNMLAQYIDSGHGNNATHIVVAFDPPGPTFRHELYDWYKANRIRSDEDVSELLPQYEMCRQACDAFGVARIEIPGFEADDIIATLVHKAVQKEASVTLVTSDKDMLQLLGPTTKYYDPMQKEFRNRSYLQTKFGTRKPKHVPFIQALIGDKVDNIPGAKGIGLVGAAKLAEQFDGDIENLLDNTDDIESESVRSKIEDSHEMIRMSLKLVTLRIDVPIKTKPSDMLSKIPNINQVSEFCDEMTFSSLKKRMAERISVMSVARNSGSVFD